MAKKAKEIIEKKQLSAEELQGVIRSMVKETESASELVASAGGFVKNQLDRNGLPPKVTKQSMKLWRMEESNRQSFIRDSLSQWYLLGFFDQLDMFDDTGKILTEILDRIGEPDRPRDEPDSAVTQFN